jgi:hypothetical protein
MYKRLLLHHHELQKEQGTDYPQMWKEFEKELRAFTSKNFLG